MRLTFMPALAQHRPAFLPVSNSGVRARTAAIAIQSSMGQSESSGVEVAPGEAAPRPCALVVVGPSGVGKGTLISKLMQSSSKYGFSCSHTTRAPRPGEKVGPSAAVAG